MRAPKSSDDFNKRVLAAERAHASLRFEQVRALRHLGATRIVMDQLTVEFPPTPKQYTPPQQEVEHCDLCGHDRTSHDSRSGSCVECGCVRFFNG